MSDGRVVIDITGDVSGYDRAVKELGARTQKQLSSLSKTLDTAGSALTSYITKPAIGAATAVGTIFAVKGWQRLEAIDTATGKQKESLELITENMSRIEVGMQSNTATAQESAASSEELSSLSTSLAQAVSKYKTTM